jgi:thymidylate synthase ThyX
MSKITVVCEGSETPSSLACKLHEAERAYLNACFAETGCVPKGRANLCIEMTTEQFREFACTLNDDRVRLYEFVTNKRFLGVPVWLRHPAPRPCEYKGTFVTQEYPHIKVDLICDSVSALSGDRLSTFVLTYPRSIHAQTMAHRVLSRNAQSSRAIPVARRVEAVRNNPVLPIAWLKNQAGMVAKDETIDNVAAAELIWREAAGHAASAAEQLAALGLHKQWVNRLLEPFDTITVVLSGTTFDNFFTLRTAADAQPEIRAVALRMRELYWQSEPVTRELGEWHLPFVPQDHTMSLEDAKITSAAACARVSYLNHDGSGSSIEKDRALVNRLIASGHWTPLEHQAVPCRGRNANFVGWSSLRNRMEESGGA